jgi:hypothetical protein
MPLFYTDYRSFTAILFSLLHLSLLLLIPTRLFLLLFLSHQTCGTVVLVILDVLPRVPLSPKIMLLVLLMKGDLIILTAFLV